MTVAQTISNYALWVIVAMVVLIVAWSVWSAWRTPERSDDPALSVEQAQSRARRWLLVGAAVLVPVVLGAVATVVLYATRANPPAPKAPIDTAPDTLVRDGSILIIQPRSHRGRSRSRWDQVVEIVLQPGPGQTVTAGNPAILASAPTPPCHIFTLCGIPGAQTWTFRAIGSRGDLPDDHLRQPSVQLRDRRNAVHTRSAEAQRLGQADHRGRSTAAGLTSGDRDLLLVLRQPVHAALDDLRDALDRVPQVDEPRVERSEPEAAQVRRPEIPMTPRSATARTMASPSA